MNDNILITQLDNKERCKKWYSKNKEKHLAYMKDKVDCDICKCKIVTNQIKRHEKTAKHIKNKDLLNEMPKQDIENFEIYKKKAIEYDKLREMFKNLEE